MAADGYADDGIAGEIKFKCTEPSYTKTSFEIASSVGNGTGSMVFGPTGFEIFEGNSGGTIRICISFLKSGMPYYIIKSKDGVRAHYEVYIKYREFAEILKSTGKKEHVNVECIALQSGEGYFIPAIMIKNIGGNLDSLTCLSPDEFGSNREFIPRIESSREPRAKMTMG